VRGSVWFLLVVLMITCGRNVYAEPVTVLLERQGIDEELLRLYLKVSSASLQTKFISVRAKDTVTDTLKRGGVFLYQYQPAFAPLLIELNSTDKNGFVGNPQGLTLRAGSLLIVPDFQVRALDRLERISSDKPVSLGELS